LRACLVGTDRGAQSEGFTVTPETASKAPAKREWAVNALVLLGTLFIGCIAAELMLRYVIQPRGVMTKELLIRQGITEADQAWERHDDLGWMIKSNTTFRHTSPFGEFDTLIETGDNGNRVPPGRKADAPPAERTILFIGDSVTAAYEVEYDDTFVAKVEKALQANSGKPTRAINAGIRGYSTEQSFKRMKVLFDSGIRADDVVYLFSSNDPFENMNLHFPKRFMSKPGAYLDDVMHLSIPGSPPTASVIRSARAFTIVPTSWASSSPRGTSIPKR
jgi:hypothetical protein